MSCTIYTTCSQKAIKVGAMSYYLHCFQSTFFHGLQPFNGKARICHHCGKTQATTNKLQSSTYRSQSKIVIALDGDGILKLQDLRL